MNPFLFRTAATLLCTTLAAPSVTLAIDLRQPARTALSCAEAWQETRLKESERLELIVDLAYHSMQSQWPGMRLSSAQSAVLGLVIEESCRQSPQADLGASVAMAVRIAVDAHPGASRTLAAR